MARPILALALLVAGCQADSEAEQSKARMAAIEQNVVELQERVLELEGQLFATRERLDHTDSVALGANELARLVNRDLDTTADLVDNNARVANENAIAEMTRRAACGTELVQLESGVWHNRIIPCTEADLKESRGE